jgi:uridine kinase
VEGILIFTCPELRNCLDIKVFVDADADDRLGRVIARDNLERGRSVEKVLERYEKTVKPMHLQFIEPSKRYADIIIPQGGHNQVAIDILLASIEKFLNKKMLKFENKVGLYLTIAVHLLIIIILLLAKI